MSLNESFKACVRSLERECRDQIITEQSSFAAQMANADAVETSNFPQGMALIARKEALLFVRRVTLECEGLQDLADAGDFEEAKKTIVEVAHRMLAVGSGNAFTPMLNQTANMVRGFAVKELEEEVRDRLLIAQDKRKAKGRNPALAWTLLFLQSNPRDENFLATNREYREVTQVLREADYRDQIRPVMEPAVRIRDVFRAVNEYRPRVIHFSGHGDRSCLALLDDHDQSRDFDGQHLADLIAANDDQVQLVILNTCDSLSQALKLLNAVPHVVGTKGPLDDEAALIFSRTFYGAVAHGRSIASSFRQATVALSAEIGPTATALYELRSRTGDDANTALLVAPAGK